MRTLKRLTGRRRIALVAAHYPPESMRGTEIVVRAQARELAELGHEVRIVSGTDVPYAGHDVERDLVDGIPVARIPRFVHERGLGAGPAARVVELVRAECAEVDLVHVHGTWTLSSDLVRQLARTLPVAVTLHDDLASCSDVASTSDFARTHAHEVGAMSTVEIERALARRSQEALEEVRAAALVVFPSRAHRAGIERSLALKLDDATEIAVVRHGLCIDMPMSASHPRRPYDALRPLRVLHFGNRADVKGTMDLVRALASLPQGSVELCIAGREVERGFDARWMAEAQQLSIDFHPRYDALDLAEIAKMAHVAAFPSRVSESYPLVVEEALALGLSAWVADRGAAAEIVAPVGDSKLGPGRVLPASDPESWTRAFREVLAFPMMLTRERAAIPTCLRTARDAVRELDDHYASLLANCT